MEQPHALGKSVGIPPYSKALELYDTCQGKIAECDAHIEAHLKTMQSNPGAI